MSLREKAASGLFWSATKNWGEKALSFLIFLVLSRMLGPEAFGLVAMATLFTAFAQIFLDQGLSSAIVQRGELDREHLDTAFWTSIFTGGLLTVAGIAGSSLVAALFQEPRLAPIIAWLSLGFLLGALSSTQRAILQRQLDFKSLAMRSLGATFISGVIGVSLAFMGAGVWSLVAQQLIFALAGAIILWRVSDWRPGLHFSRERFRELFAFGIHVLGGKVLEFFSRRSDDFMIGYFLGPVALGYYTVAYRLLLVMINLLTGVTTTVAFSTFSRLQGKPDRVRSAFYKVTLGTSLIAFPIFLGVSVLAPELVLVLFGPEWALSGTIMQILALIGVLLSVLYFNGSVIKSAGKPSWQLGIMFLNAACNLVAFLVVVRWGTVAVAAAYVVVSYLLAPVSFVAVHRLIQIDVKTYLGQFVTPLVASLAMVAVVWGSKQVLADQVPLAIQVAACVLAGALTYVLIVRIIARAKFEQMLELVWLVFPKLRFRKV